MIFSLLVIMVVRCSLLCRYLVKKVKLLEVIVIFQFSVFSLSISCVKFGISGRFLCICCRILVLVFFSVVIWLCRLVVKLSLLCIVCLVIFVIILFVLVSLVILLIYLIWMVVEFIFIISKFGVCRCGIFFSGVIFSCVLWVRCVVCVVSEFVR